MICLSTYVEKGPIPARVPAKLQVQFWRDMSAVISTTTGGIELETSDTIKRWIEMISPVAVTGMLLEYPVVYTLASVVPDGSDGRGLVERLRWDPVSLSDRNALDAEPLEVFSIRMRCSPADSATAVCKFSIPSSMFARYVPRALNRTSQAMH